MKKRLREALREDWGRGDKTSDLLISASARGRASVISRENGIFCGADAARSLASLTDRSLTIRFLVREGGSFRKGQTILRLRGRVRSILKIERVLLNFLGHLCGIATATRDFTGRVKPFHTRIFDTRKTTPLWRELEKYAVRAGGGRNHRMNLSALFVKENHRGYGKLKKLARRRDFVIEVRNSKEVDGALTLRPRVILLDNFRPAQLKRAVKIIRRQNRRVQIEASGGVTLANVRQVARTGVDRISVGSLTHSVKAIDFSLGVTG